MVRGALLQNSTSGLSMKKSIGDWLPVPEKGRRPSRQPGGYPSGTLWPHGEWSYGWGKERPDGGEHQQSDIEVSDRALNAVCDGSAAAFAVDAERERLERLLWFEGGEAEGPPLDLSVMANSHKRAKRGKKGITGYGQQMIKAAGYLLQEKYPRHRMTLGTITLPPMSQQTRRELVAAWPEILRQLLQWQSRRLKRLGLPPVVLSVSEIQPRRLSDTGEAVLHLHQLWPNVPARHGKWSFSPNLVRSYLSRLLMRLIPSYTWGFINVDTRPVDGEAAAYLAKYMSKGKQMVVEALKDWGEDNCPPTWWNMTKPARDMVKRHTLRGREAGKVLDECLNHAWQAGVDEVYAFLRPCEIEIDNSRIIMGWRGRFLQDTHWALRRVLESFDIEGFKAIPEVA